jgi:thiol-disulfide isomerase/thioredoxin
MLRSVALLLTLLLTATTALATSIDVGATAPAFEGRNGAGEQVRFDPAQRERPALILFWATWCPYCKALMPHLQTLRNYIGADQLDVYAVDILEDEGADPAGFLASHGYDFTLVRADDTVPASYGVRGTPALFLVGTDGRVDYVRPNGAKPEAIVTTLRGILAGSKSAE